MAVWGNGELGRLGLEITTVNTSSTICKVTVKLYLWTKYSTQDSNNTFYFDWGKTEATTSIGKKSIYTTVNNGWSESNKVLIGTYTTSYKRETKDLTGKVAAKCTGIEYIGETLTISTIFTVQKRPQYTVTFTNGCGTTLKTEKVFAEYDATPPVQPTRIGYTFAGWNGTYTNITSNQTITAKWTINKYQLKYDANDGRGIVKTETYDYGTVITKVGTDIVRKGYILKGWSVNKDAQEPEYGKGESYKIAGNVTFYAIWKKEEVLFLKTEAGYKPCKPYIRVNGVWKSAVPYIKADGRWKQGMG